MERIIVEITCDVKLSHEMFLLEMFEYPEEKTFSCEGANRIEECEVLLIS